MTSFDDQQTTASKIWALAAAQRGAELLRGGQCSVPGPTWELTLLDGRTFIGCGMRQDGESLVLTLCESSYGTVELWTTMENLAGEPLPHEPLTDDAGQENLAP